MLPAQSLLSTYRQQKAETLLSKGTDTLKQYSIERFFCSVARHKYEKYKSKAQVKMEWKPFGLTPELLPGVVACSSGPKPPPELSAALRESMWHDRRSWHFPIHVLQYTLFRLTKSLFYTFSYKSIIIHISSFSDAAAFSRACANMKLRFSWWLLLLILGT